MFRPVWRAAVARDPRSRLDPANLPRDVASIIGEYVLQRIRENMDATAIDCQPDAEPIGMLRGELVTVRPDSDDPTSIWHGDREVYRDPLLWHPGIDGVTCDVTWSSPKGQFRYNREVTLEPRRLYPDAIEYSGTCRLPRQRIAVPECCLYYHDTCRENNVSYSIYRGCNEPETTIGMRYEGNIGGTDFYQDHCEYNFIMAARPDGSRQYLISTDCNLFLGTPIVVRGRYECCFLDPADFSRIGSYRGLIA